MRRDHFKNHDWELAGMLLEVGDMMVTCVCFLIDLFLLLGVYLCILYMHIYAVYMYIVMDLLASEVWGLCASIGMYE